MASTGSQIIQAAFGLNYFTMKITEVESNIRGIRSFLIDINAISYPVLLRCIRRIPGAVIAEASRHPITGDVLIIVRYKDITIEIDTPLSDYTIHCTSSSAACDEFVSRLGSYQVKWWDHLPQFDETEFTGNKFVFWIVGMLLLLLFALVFPNVVSHGISFQLVFLAALILMSLLLVLGLYNPRRFWWSLCCFTAIIFLFYFWRLIGELTDRNKSEIFEAALGLFVIGLPCLFYTITGFVIHRRKNTGKSVDIKN